MMRERGGVVALLAAFSAAAFHVGSVSTSPKTAGQPRPIAVSSAGKKNADADLLKVLRPYETGETLKSPLGTGSCSARRETGTSLQPAGIDWIIATVPDPEHSNLKLDFDREIESIQIAAEASGYQFERFWLPWKTSEGTGETVYSISAETAGDGAGKTIVKPEGDHAREDLPGVLSFRQSRVPGAPPLMVFLVRETPTAGVSPNQFRNAVCYGNYFGRPDAHPRLRILGPGFSGSFYSLGRLTEEYQADFDGVFLRTWSSDFASHQRFLTALKQRSQGVSLLSTRAPSVESINTFVSYLHDTWNETGPILLLVEESTGLASGIGRANIDKGPAGTLQPLIGFAYSPTFILKFPRNLSTLRNATESESHLPGFGDDKQLAMPRSGLQLSLKDDEGDATEIPKFSKAQTPVSQEAVLFGIGALLKTNTVHYVGIVASDPLDTLFLARYLRSACPNLRLFTLDSDLLFEHGSDSSDYEGLIAVSSYPLFPMTQIWAGSRNTGTLHVFPSNNFEAIYNAATSVLLNVPGSPTNLAPTSAQFRDYVNPFHRTPGEAEHPPLWISVAGRSGFEPVAALQIPTGLLEGHTGINPSAMVPEYWPGWAYCFYPILMLCVLYCFLIAWASPNGSRTFAIFSIKPREGGLRSRAFYLAALGACLSALVALWLVAPGAILRFHPQFESGFDLLLPALLLVCAGSALMIAFWIVTANHRADLVAAPSWKAVTPALAAANCFLVPLLSFPWLTDRFRDEPTPVFVNLWTIYLVSCVVLGALMTAVVCVTLETARLKVRRFNGRWHLLSSKNARPLLLVALVTAPVIGYAFATVFRRNQGNFLAACRSLDLTSGVSPLVPATLLIFSFVLLAYTHLRRHTYDDDHFPQLPELPDDPFCPELGKLSQEIRRRITSLFWHPVYALPLVILTAGFLLFLWRRGHQTFEDAELERLMFALAVGGGAVLIHVCLRFMLIWSVFREFLQQLERHPLRSVFSLLPRDFVWSPVWQGGGKHRTHVALTRSLECVLALKRNSESPTAFRTSIASLSDGFQEKVSEILRISTDRKRIPVRLYGDVEGKLSVLAEQAASHLALVRWPKGSYELKAELSAKDELKDAMRVQQFQYEKEEPEMICGELLAYRFLAFINYVLWQLENLVSYLSVGFLLLVVAMSSYQFRSRTIIEWCMVALFVFVSIGIVMVFAQADRDAILSRITGTEEGKLDRHFFTHVISYGLMPVLVLAATHFPTVGRFFFSWVKPALEAIH